MGAKFVFLTGGVVSAIGKGLTGASIGALMEARGFTVNNIKLDPYLNVDPGTMSPYQHGEVFVTDDGAETDLDLGHYERFTSVTSCRTSNCTCGSIYESVLQRERRGGYLGETVQVIPHITDEIKTRIYEAAKNVDIAIVEIGGTVGDIESIPFLEAVRQMRVETGKKGSVSIHVTLVPFIAAAGELKTKPTQHSVRKMMEIGIQPDILVCRSDRPIPQEARAKLALFSNVPAESVITAVDVDFIYKLPLVLHEEGLDQQIVEYLGIQSETPNLNPWQNICNRHKNPKETVRIGVVGKYVQLQDSYKSLNEALTHGALANNVRLELHHIDSEQIESYNTDDMLGELDGILVPGGFGNRGTDGKIEAIRYAREKWIPFFGICLGMQLAVVEFARNCCGLKGANSTEFDQNTPHPVIDLMPDQCNIKNMGGTMRLGAFPCTLKNNTFAWSAYQTKNISERHRHRYELANSYRELLESKGMIFSGVSPDQKLVEIVELSNRAYFLACQFHPEFKSRIMNPHPLFVRFIQATRIGGR